MVRVVAENGTKIVTISDGIVKLSTAALNLALEEPTIFRRELKNRTESHDSAVANLTQHLRGILRKNSTNVKKSKTETDINDLLQKIAAERGLDLATNTLATLATTPLSSTTSIEKSAADFWREIFAKYDSDKEKEKNSSKITTTTAKIPESSLTTTAEEFWENLLKNI